MATINVDVGDMSPQEATQFLNKLRPIQYKYTSTKEYHDAFPCAYRQWRADSHCNLIHGYAMSFHFEFEADT